MQDEPTSRELFKALCDRKIGGLFKKCRQESPTPAPKKEKKGKKEEKSKGKGERRRRTLLAENENEEILMILENLSSNDKTRLLIAAEEGDDATVNVIFENNSPSSDLNGRTLFKKLCDRKIGGLFKKCRDDEAPTPAPKKGKKGKKEEKAKGKGERHGRALAERKANDLLALVNNLSLDDKKRVLIATDEGDEDTINMIFDKSIQENDMDGRTLFKKLCDRKIGGLFKKCRDDEAPTPAPKKGKKGKKDDKAKGKGERHRRAWEGSESDDLVMFIGKLSRDEKMRLLDAIESEDDAVVDAIFDRFF